MCSPAFYRPKITLSRGSARISIFSFSADKVLQDRVLGALPTELMKPLGRMKDSNLRHPA
jgi:hypothetical protein